MTISYSDKYGWYRGTFKDELFTIWNKGIPRKEFAFVITLDELERGLRTYGNSYYIVRDITQNKKYEAEDRWVEQTKDQRLREVRRKRMYDDCQFGRGGCLDSLATDSAHRVVRELYRKAFGKYPKSWYERRSS